MNIFLDIHNKMIILASCYLPVYDNRIILVYHKNLN